MQQPQHHNHHYYKSHRVYIRTIGALTLSSVIVFSVLCIAYYQRLSSSIISSEYNSLAQTAEAAIGDYQTYLRTSTGADLQKESQGSFFRTVMAYTPLTSVWVVDMDGIIKSYSGSSMPKEVSGQLIYDTSYRIPEIYTRSLLRPSGGFDNSTQNALFVDSHHTWISISYPIPNTQDYLMLHKKVDVETQAFELMTNGLGIPVLISFALSLVLFLLVTRSFVRPIRLLSEAAMKVADGDLSTRIRVPEEDNDSPVRFFVPDELSDMIRTVNLMIERLETQENDRRVFISSIAHDLRTPLTSIKGFITAIQDGTIPPKDIPHYLGIVSKEVDRLQNLAHSMTEVSSLSEVGGIKPEPVDIRETLYGILDSLENEITKKDLSIEVEGDLVGDNPLRAICDPKGINRVLYNLINNAVKFTPEHGAICLSVKMYHKSSLMYVSIEDSGPGIPRDKRSRIFDSFYKIDTSRSKEGSGLGLYICREIIRAHGQRIVVEKSKVLGGARFTFSLKMAKTEEGTGASGSLHKSGKERA